MAHFAELDENNIVLRVIVVNEEDCLDENGAESEVIGVNFCKNIFGENTNWLQCSYSNKIRKRYPGVGYRYDKNHDIFVEPRPFPSWSFDEETLEWNPPISFPDYTPGYHFGWDEDNQRWIKIFGELDR
jgi:hypothetical protein